MTDTIRNLDVAESASADLMQLNNMVVSMRKVVKTAKVHVIRGLIRQLKQLKDKPGHEGKVNTREREIDIIKSLACDKVSKYALGNTTTFADVCKQAHCSLEIKSLARLTDNSVIQKKVEEFRCCHDDWQSLAMYLMAKQSGRRFHKQRNQKDQQTIVANRKTGDAMIRNLVKEKFKGHNMEEVIGRTIESTGIIEEDEVIEKRRRRRKRNKALTQKNVERNLVEKQPVTCELPGGNKDSHIIDELMDHGEGNEEEGVGDGNIEEIRIASSDEEQVDNRTCVYADESDVDVSGGFTVSCSPTSVMNEPSQKDRKCTKKVDKTEKVQGKDEQKAGVFKGMDSGETIVRQLDLSELDNEAGVLIFQNTQKIQKCKGETEFKRKKDRFFAGDDDDDASYDDGDADVHAHAYNNIDPEDDNGRAGALRHIRSSFVCLRESEDKPCDNSGNKDGDNPGRNKLQQHTNNSQQNDGDLSHKRPDGSAIERSKSNYESRNVGNSQAGASSVWSRTVKRNADEPTMLAPEGLKIPAGKGLNHPSWAASRKRADNMKVRFQGKKMKFEDSD